MKNYYALVAGLPNIAFDDSKITYTIDAFREELGDQLSTSDKKLIDLFFFKFTNKNLLDYLNNPECSLDARGSMSTEDFAEFIQAAKNEEPYKSQSLPSYFNTFMYGYMEEKQHDSISWEDQLASLYYEYASRCRNEFVSAWFELNLNINNILAAFTCRKYDLDKLQYIVGDNEVAQAIRNSNARDFGLGDMADYLPELQRITEESDLLEREKKIDMFKWNWIEDNIFFHYFSVETIFAYVLKLEMIERWVTLDKKTGEQMFREIVQELKQGSLSSLEDFKRNNNK